MSNLSAPSRLKAIKRPRSHKGSYCSSIKFINYLKNIQVSIQYIYVKESSPCGRKAENLWLCFPLHMG